MEKNTKDYNPEITKEDKKMLGDQAGNLKRGKGQDMELKNRKDSVDFAGKDLDIPGRTLPKNKNGKIIKDEENQLYSQGASGNEILEQSQNPIE